MREWLYNLRKNNGMTLKDLADKLNISEAYLSMIENGERQKKMEITLAVKIASIFGIPIENVIDEEMKRKDGND